ncbi:MAG: PocR ligand-binding domain-containing protein [Lachnospiraceae bacterium]|nr:PocR ligand-binding domain-containing protein [Lachnospiraceae bacterium]
MIEYKDQKIDFDKLEIKDIIDVHVLQSFLDNFAIAVNCAAVSVDLNGQEVTKPSYYRDFCQEYIHKSTVGDQRCAVCHNEMGEKAVKQGKPYIGHCHAGLIDFAAPIMVEGHHIGTVLGGQILDSQPNVEKMRDMAPELGIAPDDIEKAAKKIDIVSARNIQAAAEVLFVVVNSMAQSGYSRLEIEYLSNTLADNFIRISEVVENLTSSAADISANQQVLEAEITEVGTLIEQIEKIMASIMDIAKRIKMIGLNASIEAARLGTDGQGFAVVANEIQHLSANTTQVTAQVTNLNKSISEKLASTVENSQKTLEVTENQSAEMKDLYATIQESVKLAENIRVLFTE